MQAAIFDLDGTLVDSVDLHAFAWHEAFAKFGHQVSFQQARSQIGKGGDKLLPIFLTNTQIDDYGHDLQAWRAERFHQRYLSMVRPFSGVRDLLERVRDEGLQIGVASSAKDEELQTYLDIADVTDLVEITVSASDVEESKPAPDAFEVALEKLGIESGRAVAIGDSPYDAQAARRTGLGAIGLLSGCFLESDLRASGCEAVYTSPSGLLACFDSSPLMLKTN